MMLVVTVLKVVGIILLILLVLIIAVVSYVLFSPVGYKIGIDAGEHIDFFADINDFLGLARFHLGYLSTEGMTWGLYLLHLKKPFLPKERTDRKLSDEEDEKVKDQTEEVTMDKTPQNEVTESNTDITYNNIDNNGNFKNQSANIGEDKYKKKHGKKAKRRAKDEKESKRDYIAIIRDPSSRSAIRFLFSSALELLKRLKPKKIYADMDFSTGEPDLTGEITGALSLMPFSYGKKVRITPDFAAENPYINGELILSGSIALFHILGVAVKIFLNKDVRKLYKSINK